MYVCMYYSHIVLILFDKYRMSLDAALPLLMSAVAWVC